MRVGLMETETAVVNMADQNSVNLLTFLKAGGLCVSEQMG